MTLTAITPKRVESWLLELRVKKKDSGRSLAGTTINHCLTTLGIMLKEAVRFGYIPDSPAARVEQLKETPREKTILDFDEVQALFRRGAIDDVWHGDLRHFALNLLEASTDTLMGESPLLYARLTRTRLPGASAGGAAPA